LLATLLASFCFVTLVGVISFVKQNPPQKEIEAAVSFSGGSGTQYDPYEISTPSDVQEFFSNPSKYKEGYYEVTQDINCSEVSFSSSFQFSGVFDGGGNTLYNLKSFNHGVVPKQNDDPYKPKGLFGRLNETAVVKNLCLEDCSYTTSLKGETNSIIATNCSIGIIAATANKGAKIDNCKVKNFKLINTYEPIWNDWYDQYWQISGICLGNYATITNCYVENLQYQKTTSSDKTSQMKLVINYLANHYNSIENCVVRENGGDADGDTYESNQNVVTAANNISGWTSSVYSSSGGEDGPPWYYVGSQYNSGWPMLRVFMDWKTVNFSASPSGGGSVNPTSIQIPSGATITDSRNGRQINILGQTVIAKENSGNGYEFELWEHHTTYQYIAHFKLKQYTLNFAESTGDVSEDPSSFSYYKVNHGTSISGPSNGATGTISYTFGSQTVTYDIPTGYYFDSDDRPNSITEDTTITPKILQLKYDINIGGEGGTWGDWISVGASSASLTGIVYGTEIQYSVTTKTIVLQMNGQKKVFTANSGYEIDYLLINGVYYHPGASGTIIVRSQIDIYACALKLYEITFADAVDEEGCYIDKYGQTGIATLTPNPKTIKIKQGKSVTADYNATTRVLTFKHNENVVAIYTGKEYYAILQETDKDEIKVVNDSSDLTIQPIFTFYACLVTMGKTDNTNIVDIYVEGNKIESEEHKLIVEFGTVVNFTASQSDGLFTYTYSFSSGEVVEYKITDDKYAMSSEKDSDTRMWHTELEDVMHHTFDGPEDGYVPTDDMQYKTISPTFELKQYSGNLA